ncbi:uncharacterized protein BO80DRAFT_119178 [Aspergillus ibericus CBS 121593]|uniref:Uncharacterized protein n=1 Tax=Aspergillus ibericus CBS 121593 TaxID=1448316 RepID=A0A395GW28_9EURO|nr:hypothetical protein BO80DRAFT_119178 [Aspergillus ibericus CBS 121593]RAK99579.1 hypothetical protein BO80DRAFT_119178 [Aspergillus ibericus CBS 121593]
MTSKVELMRSSWSRGLTVACPNRRYGCFVPLFVGDHPVSTLTLPGKVGIGSKTVWPGNSPIVVLKPIAWTTDRACERKPCTKTTVWPIEVTGDLALPCTDVISHTCAWLLPMGHCNGGRDRDIGRCHQCPGAPSLPWHRNASKYQALMHGLRRKNDHAMARCNDGKALTGLLPPGAGAAQSPVCHDRVPALPPFDEPGACSFGDHGLWSAPDPESRIHDGRRRRGPFAWSRSLSRWIPHSASDAADPLASRVCKMQVANECVLSCPSSITFSTSTYEGRALNGYYRWSVNAIKDCVNGCCENYFSWRRSVDARQSSLAALNLSVAS